MLFPGGGAAESNQGDYKNEYTNPSEYVEVED